MTELSANDGFSTATATEAAMFLSRVVYGEWALTDAYSGSNDNGYDDDYAGYIEYATSGAWSVLTADDLGPDGFDADHSFTSGGLYIGSTSGRDENYAEAIAVEAVIDGQTTIILSFRGSDGYDAGTEGQTFTADGSQAYFNDLLPLILEVLEYAADPANNVDQVIVAGHSLGGAMADYFAVTYAQQFVDAGLDLTIVSLASAGLDPLLPTVETLNPNIAETTSHYSIVDGELVLIEELVGLSEPSEFTYISFDHTLDPVRHPDLVDFVLVSVLEENIHFDSDFDIALPNIEFGHTAGTFGALHNAGIYWVNVQSLFNDGLFDQYDAQTIIMGVADYALATDIGGTLIPLVSDWNGPSASDNYIFDRALEGTSGDDYILGLSGYDTLLGFGGNDLLSGGADNDTLMGGGGRDYLDGGTGADHLNGGGRGDVLISLGDGDTLTGGHGADVFEFTAMGQGATITDFTDGSDHIDVSALGVSFADLTIRNTFRGAVVEVAEGDIQLTGVSVADLSQDDFIF